MSTREYRLRKGRSAGAYSGVLIPARPATVHLNPQQAEDLRGVVEEVGATSVPSTPSASPKVRVHEAAKALGITSKAALEALQDLGHNLHSPANTIPASAVGALRDHLADDGDREGE